MTSNVGQEEFSQKASQIGFNISQSEEDKIIQDYEKAKERVKESLSDYFSPEFLNRIDKILVFNPLDTTTIKKIVRLQLEKFNKRLQEKNLEVEFDSKVIHAITQKVYNPEFWAREVRRFITDVIEDKIAEKILYKPEEKKFILWVKKWEIILL